MYSLQSTAYVPTGMIKMLKNGCIEFEFDTQATFDLWPVDAHT